MAIAFGTNAEDALKYVFPAIDWNLQDKTAEEINKYISEQLSTIGDNAVKAMWGGMTSAEKYLQQNPDVAAAGMGALEHYTYFGQAEGRAWPEAVKGLIDGYQQVGEGLYETAVRLVVQKETILKVLDMTGKAFSGTAMEGVALTQSLIEIAGSMDALTEAASTYYDKFFTDAEKQVDRQESLTGIMANLNKEYPTLNAALGDTRKSYRDQIEALDLTTEAGKNAYVVLMKAAGIADEYYSVIEEGSAKILTAKEILEKTNDLNLQLMEAEGKGFQVQAILRAKAIQELGGLNTALGQLQDQLNRTLDALAILNKMGDLRIRLMTAEGNVAGALAASRLIEIANLRKEFGTAAESMILYMNAIWANEDLATALNEQTKAEDALATAKANLVSAAQEEISVQEELIQNTQDLADKQKDLVDALEDTAKMISNWILDLSQSNLAPVISAESYDVEYARQKALATAEGATQEQMSSFLEYAKTYLEYQQGFGTSGNYLDVYNAVMRDVKGLESAVRGQVNAEKTVLTTLSAAAVAQKGSSVAIIQAAKDIIAANKVTNQTVAQATAAVTVALAALISAQGVYTAALAASVAAKSAVPIDTGTVVDTNQTLINKIKTDYQTLFGREAEPAGITYWTNFSNATGATGASLTAAIHAGAQGGDIIRNTIIDAYRMYFGREAEQAGITYWTNFSNATGKVDSALSNSILWGARGDDLIARKAIMGFAKGLDYVPRNNFTASLHEGEAVLNRQAAQAWRDSNSNNGNVILIEEVRKLRAAIEKRNDGQDINVRLDVDGREIGNVVARQVSKNDDLRQSIRRVAK
jgi:hypothetical protein